MDVQKIVEKAGEGSVDDVRAAIQSEIDAAVTSATKGFEEKLTEAHETSKGLKESVRKLESKRDELLDELKPLKRAKAGEKDPEADPKTEPQLKPEEIAREMVDQATQRHAEELEAREKAFSEIENELKNERNLRRFKAFEAEVIRQTTGYREVDGKRTAKPRLNPSLYEFFLQKMQPYVNWEDSNGQERMVLRNEGVPIMVGSKHATIADLIDQAYEGDGKNPWSTDTRDFFLTEHSGGGAASLAPGAKAGQIDMGALGKAQSTAEYEKLRGQMNG